MALSDVSTQLYRLSQFNSGPIGVVNPFGLGADGHQTNFPQACADVAAVANEVGQAITQAALPVSFNNLTWIARSNANGGDGNLDFVVSKQGTANKASIGFASALSRRSELGLIFNNDTTLRTSADGVNWNEAMRATPAGLVGFGFAAPVTKVSISAPLGVTNGLTLAMDGQAQRGRIGFQGGAVQEFFLTNNWSPSTNAVDNAALTTSAIIMSTGTVLGIRMATNATPGGLPIERWRLYADGTFAPALDNAYTLGGNGLRASAIWAANGVIQTSDARAKLVSARVEADAAMAVVAEVQPVLFRWREGGNTEVKELDGFEWVDEPAFEEVEVLDHEVCTKDGKATLMPITRRDRVAIMDQVPLFDEAGQAVMEDGEPKMVSIQRMISVKRPKFKSVVVTAPGRRVHAGFLAQEVKAALDAQGIECGAWGLEDAQDEASGQWLRPDQMMAILWAAVRQNGQEIASLRARLRATPAQCESH
jgi:hypothetical protein